MANALFNIETGLELQNNYGVFSGNGNVVVNAVQTSGGLYWTGNGKSISGITITASSNPPTVPPPSIGDQWYNTSTDVVYQYQNDGTSSYWVDISTSVINTTPNTSPINTLITDSIKANLGAYQAFANTSIGALQSNIGAYHTYANATTSAYQTYANTNQTKADAFYTYANSKIGTNTNSNLVVAATTTSTSKTTGALVVKGGAGIDGNVYADKLYTTQGLFWAGNGFPVSGGTGGTAAGNQGSLQFNDGGTFNGSTLIYDGTSGNLVIPATTNSTALTTGALVVGGGVGAAGQVSAGGLLIDNTTGGYFANISSYARPASGTQSWRFYANPGIGGPGSWMSFPDGTNQFTAYPGTSTTLDDFDANIGAFQTYANTKIGSNADGNLVVVATTASTDSTTGALVVGGGAGIAGNINIGGNLIASGYSNVSIATGSLTNRSALTISGNVYGRGGIGYLDAVQLTNNYSAATNPNKYIRVGSTGTFEIINSAYTTNLFNLTDAGALSLPGPISISGKKAVNGPAFSAYADAVLQTITSGSQQKVLFQTEEFDTDGCYANSRFTPTTEGYYQLNAEVRLDGASGTGEIMIVLYKNTSEHKRGTNQSGSSIGTNFYAMTVSALVYANGTTDYFEIKVQQTSGGDVTVTAVNNPAITWFNGAMVRGA